MVKLQVFLEGHKIWNNLPHGLTLHSKYQIKWEIVLYFSYLFKMSELKDSIWFSLTKQIVPSSLRNLGIFLSKFGLGSNFQSIFKRPRALFLPKCSAFFVFENIKIEKMHVYLWWSSRFDPMQNPFSCISFSSRTLAACPAHVAGSM